MHTVLSSFRVKQVLANTCPYHIQTCPVLLHGMVTSMAFLGMMLPSSQSPLLHWRSLFPLMNSWVILTCGSTRTHILALTPESSSGCKPCLCHRHDKVLTLLSDTVSLLRCHVVMGVFITTKIVVDLSATAIHRFCNRFLLWKSHILEQSALLAPICIYWGWGLMASINFLC